MHTLRPRWGRLVAGLGLVACSHPGPTPRAPEPDDERAGAIELVWSDETKNFTAEGALDASAGDIVDWFTLTLPAGVKSSFTVSVDGLGRAAKLPMSIDVGDSSARVVGRVEVEAEGSSDIAYGSGFVASDRLYLRLDAHPGSKRAAYRVAIQNVYEVPPPGPLPCDPNNWDASNPRCEHVCNRKKPDLRSVACCDLMRPCSKGIAVMPCMGAVTGFADGMFWVSVGRADAGVEFLPAYLPAPSGEPPVYTPAGKVIAVRDHRHHLELVAAQDHTSVWRLRDPQGHDAAWIAANASFEIPPLPVCR